MIMDGTANSQDLIKSDANTIFISQDSVMYFTRVLSNPSRKLYWKSLNIIMNYYYYYYVLRFMYNNVLKIKKKNYSINNNANILYKLL